MKRVSTRDIPRNWKVICETSGGKVWEKSFALGMQAEQYATDMERKYRAKTKVVPELWDGNPDTYCEAYQRANECESICYAVARRA